MSLVGMNLRHYNTPGSCIVATEGIVHSTGNSGTKRIDSLITNIITGTDTGSVILQNLLRVIVAASILIGVVMSIGRGGGIS